MQIAIATLNMLSPLKRRNQYSKDETRKYKCKTRRPLTDLTLKPLFSEQQSK